MNNNLLEDFTKLLDQYIQGIGQSAFLLYVVIYLESATQESSIVSLSLKYLSIKTHIQDTAISVSLKKLEIWELLEVVRKPTGNFYKILPVKDLTKKEFLRYCKIMTKQNCITPGAYKNLVTFATTHVYQKKRASDIKIVLDKKKPSNKKKRVLPEDIETWKATHFLLYIKQLYFKCYHIPYVEGDRNKGIYLARFKRDLIEFFLKHSKTKTDLLDYINHHIDSLSNFRHNKKSFLSLLCSVDNIQNFLNTEKKQQVTPPCYIEKWQAWDCSKEEVERYIQQIKIKKDKMAINNILLEIEKEEKHIQTHSSFRRLL